MELAIANIRRLCPPNLKLATAGISTQIHEFGLTKQQFFRECSSMGEEVIETNIIALPTFFGNITSGHWYLAIIHQQHGVTSGYIVDSAGYSNERTSYVHAALSQVDITINEWTYFPSIRQYELECGPRVIHTICDIIDQLQNDVHIEFILGNLEKYRITTEILSRQSRTTMQTAIENCLNVDTLINFIQEDEDANDSEQRSRLSMQHPRINENKKQPNFNKRTESKAYKTATTENTLLSRPVTTIKCNEGIEQQRTPLIDRVITHQENGDGTKIFYFHKKGYTDDLLFAYPNDLRKHLHKNDRKLLNRYIATRQGKYLYQMDMSLLRVLDREQKMIDHRYMTTRKVTEMTIYLTKRGNGNDTVISWEPEARATIPMETTYMSRFRKGRHKNLKPMNIVIDDDSPWGIK